MRGTRWPEVEDSLRARGFFQLLCVAAAITILVVLPRAHGHALQLAAVAGVGALGGYVVTGILDVWFYLRPAPIRFEERGGEPSIVVGLVSQAAQVVFSVCVVVAATALTWQFGPDQVSLQKHERGPFVPFALVAMAGAGLAVWARVSEWPGRRPELVITTRGVAERRTGSPFTVPWSAITAVEEVNEQGSFWGRKPHRNFIAIDTVRGVRLHVEATHVKASAYEVFELLRALHADPRRRSRIGRVSSVAELLTEPTSADGLATTEELPFWQPTNRRALVAGVLVAIVAIPFALMRAGDTPLLAGHRTEEVSPAGTNESAGDASFDELDAPPDQSPSKAPTTCVELRRSQAVLTELIAGLRTVDARGRSTSRTAAPSSQVMVRAAGEVAGYASFHLKGQTRDLWLVRSESLQRAAQDAWYIENSNAGPRFSWAFLAQQEPDLMRVARQTRAAISETC